MKIIETILAIFLPLMAMAGAGVMAASAFVIAFTYTFHSSNVPEWALTYFSIGYLFAVVLGVMIGLFKAGVWLTVRR